MGSTDNEVHAIDSSTGVSGRRLHFVGERSDVFQTSRIRGAEIMPGGAQFPGRRAADVAGPDDCDFIEPPTQHPSASVRVLGLV